MAWHEHGRLRCRVVEVKTRQSFSAATEWGGAGHAVDGRAGRALAPVACGEESGRTEERESGGEAWRWLMYILLAVLETEQSPSTPTIELRIR